MRLNSRSFTETIGHIARDSKVPKDHLPESTASTQQPRVVRVKTPAIQFFGFHVLAHDLLDPVFNVEDLDFPV
jgi:hypothetical protein